MKLDVFTCQGLEFDYVGVIIGEDIRYENGKIITDFTKRDSGDKSIKGIKKLYKENKKRFLCPRRDSNSRPPDYETVAMPTSPLRL